MLITETLLQGRLMVFNLGGFKFFWYQVDVFERDSDYGISSTDRLNNYKAFFSTYKGSQTINLTCKTLPFRKDGNNALAGLYELAAKRESFPLTNAKGEYFGKFIILNISESRAVFDKSGGFFYQKFSLELEADNANI